MDKKMYIKYKNKRYVWDISRFKENMRLILSIILLIIMLLWASGMEYRDIVGI